MIRDLGIVLARLSLSTGGLAQLLGVDVRTVQRYLAGEREVPEPTWRLLDLALELPGARDRLERKRS